MRIRLPFAGVFLLLLLVAGYAGLSQLQVEHYVNDKFMHASTFFLLTVAFYWVVDTSRRRTLHMTLFVCALCLGVGSEFVQSFLPNDRDFDLYDIVANVVGSLAGVGLCSWYHKRMLDRKRQRKTYNAVPGDDAEDLELGDGQEIGITSIEAAASSQARTLEQEVDNWDENAPDEWEDEDGAGSSAPPPYKSKESGAADTGEAKKRTD
ncbi:uncharacterized protein UV8b_05434 [Ustilaginoidea virens]|uniref:VanZ-like domain-containing protein n=1 Tax=Ustilaginoidea virens TaxID=1159556 RepID=A0A1B5L564_USTVR|nr:uncharacterized protein UV8b_05434 [Ustilaginoidea virens]QUC21191.1 hypothetical protein UV8b_05434 [Ustilaginoidea virens]GAO18608.1 hypothetical protein UVI_02062010 [Ustilaginoidea virens]